MADLAALGVHLPNPHSQVYSNQQTATLDHDGDKGAMIFQSPKTGNIRKVSFRTGAVTASDTLKLSLQGVNASGDPDGVILPVGVNTAYGTQGSLAAQTLYQVQLAADLAVTVGDLLACVLEFNSFVAGNLQVALAKALGSAVVGWTFPYIDVFTAGGSWAKGYRGPLISLEYDDGSFDYVVGCSPASTALNLGSHVQNVDQDLNPHEYGIHVTLPFACRAIGWWAFLTTAAAADFEVKLYGPSTLTYVASAAKLFAGAGYVMSGRFADHAHLVADTPYRMTIHSTSATAVGLWYVDAASAAAMDSLELGQTMYATQKSNAGAWTETTTRRHQMGLIVDQITTPAAGGVYPVIGGSHVIQAVKAA